MNPDNSFVNNFPLASLSARSIKVSCVLFFIALLMHEPVRAQQQGKNSLQRNATIVNKADLPFYTNKKTDNRALSNNRSLCEFTLTPVNATTNPLSQIIQSLAGSGVTISNIQSNLPATSDIYGSFSCGSAANLGMESGLLLTTGVVANAKGPNSFSGTSTDNSLPGSTLLAPLTGGGEGFDASIVSFDIVSNTNTITFQYVFASEEYNEFVNLGYNDVFGFFISGPGITGSQNIAVLPNTNTPVNIDNINNGLNSQYYLDNETQQVADPIRFANIEYDGLTVVLTATATVQPGSTYTLTLAIEDVGDGIYDSGVFIKGGSITSGAPTINCPANQTVAAPSGQCSVTVTGIDPTVSPQGTAYDYTLSGATTATGNGTASGQTFNGGVTTVTYKITNALSVSCSFTVTVNTNVVPSVSIVANPGNTICAGTNVTFTATPTNGGTPSYQWKLNGNNVGTNSNTYSNNALANGDVVTVVMTSSLACASPTTATSNGITMTINTGVSAGEVAGASPLCIGQTSTYTSNGTSGGSWSSSNTSVATVNSTTGLVTALTAGTTNIIYTIIGNCGAVNASKMLTVSPNISAGVVSGLTTLSVGATTLYSSTGSAGGTWSSTNSGAATVNASTGLVAAVSAGTTNITYTVNSGCGSPVSAFQALTVTASGGIVFCGPKNDKLLVCHNGVEICIAPAALQTHLAHGDIQGHCPASNRFAISEPDTENKLFVTAYPNPYETQFKLSINSPVSGNATIVFYTVNGVKIYEMKQYVIAGKSIVIDVKSLNSFKTTIIYRVSIGKHQANGIILRPSE